MEQIMTATEAAELLDLHPSRIRALAGAGQLRGRKVGRDWIFIRKDVVAFGELDRTAGRPPSDQVGQHLREARSRRTRRLS